MNEVIVRSPFSHRERFYAETPSGIVDVFDEVLLEDGTMGLKKTGEQDLNEYIQSFREESLIYNLLDRFQKTNDPSIFNVKSGFYADVTNMPKDLMEAQNLMLSIDKKFASLSAVVKDKFDNNSKKFAAAILDGSIDKIIGDIAQSELGNQNAQKSEVNVNEQK